MTSSILVVDDDTRLVQLIAMFFENKGYEVLSAGGGIAALEVLETATPDVVVLDLLMPDLSGIEVCREIRSLYPEVACVMLTSFADDEALFASIMAGAAGYVLKQIRGSDLVTSIRRVAAGERRTAMVRKPRQCASGLTSTVWRR